ncbi:MAG: caspase family protein [Cyanophyceae cyanobacterium]
MASTRRTFLNQLLITAVGLGWDPGWLTGAGTRYGAALAANTRKLAILVGINRYGSSSNYPPLQGCLMDVELQRELLLHRFGFDPGDIIVLTNEEATLDHLDQILASAARSSLRPLETLVFHFSGYGRLVQQQPLLAQTPPLSGSDSPATLNLATDGVMVPAFIFNGNGQQPQDVPLSTWFERINLSTPQVTSVVDCGFAYTDPALRGGLRLRSRPALFQATAGSQPAGDAIVGAAMASPTFPPLSRGLMLSATMPQDLAAEAVWSGFTAGILSYLLTQYLWESTPAEKLYTAFDQLTTQRELSVLACQKPSLQGSRWRAATPYFLQASSDAATGVLQEIKGNRASVWLGGIPPAVLCGIQAGTTLVPSDPSGAGQSPLVIRSRTGLVAQVSTDDSEGSWPAIGTRLKEESRILSSHLKLRVGLDDSLGRIEKVDITSALSELSWAEATNPRDQQVDCLIGKVTTTDRLTHDAGQGILNPDSYGLFWPGRQMLFSSFGSSGEAARGAIQRLTPLMQHVLAAKRLRTTLNGGVSHLGLSALLFSDQSGKTSPSTLRQRTAQAPAPTIAPPLRETGLPQFDSGEMLSLELHNSHAQELFIYLALLDSSGQLNLLAPNPQQALTQPLVLASGSTATIPPRIEVSSRSLPDLFTCGSRGLTELFVVASTTPFSESLALGASMARERGVSRMPMLLSRPLDWVQAVVIEMTKAVPEADMRRLNHQSFACLSMVYGVS